VTEKQLPEIVRAKPQGLSSRKGRLLDHVHLVVASLERSKKFYLAVVESIGLKDALAEKNDCFSIDELYVDEGVGK
jgi:catechol-2,3-dioxygenase